jgi:hypothetical protein
MKIVIIILTVLILTSCIVIDKVAVDSHYVDNLPGNIRSVEDARNWVIRNIIYERDINNIWQLPSETLRRRKGDCEDMALLAAFIMVKRLGIKPKIIGAMGHIWLLVGDKLMDSVSRYIWKYAHDSPGRIYTYEQAMQKALDQEGIKWN